MPDKCTSPAIWPIEGCRVGRIVVLSICERQRRLMPEKGYEDRRDRKYPDQILEGLQDAEFFARFLVVFVKTDAP